MAIPTMRAAMSADQKATLDRAGAALAASTAALTAAVREVFMKHHADLLDAAFWQSHQARIRAGHVFDVFPYEQQKRFAVMHGLAHTG